MNTRWSYVAEDQSGRVVRGQITAASDAGVLAALRADRLKPIRVRPDKSNRSAWAGGRIGPTQLAKFSRALSDLLVSGIPIGSALEALGRQRREVSLAALIKRLSKQVRSGASLSAALKADPARPPRLMVALASAGEASGRLGEELAALSDSLEEAARLRRELISQLLYPAALTLLVFLTIFFLSWFVLPEFEKVFSFSDAKVPPETRFVLGVGAWIRANGVWIPPIGLGSTATLVLLIRQFEGGFERFVLAIPLLGPVLRQVEAGRYCRTLGTLVSCGTPLAKALPIAEDVIGAKSVRDRARLASNDVKSGAGLAEALGAYGVVNQESLGFIDVGERTGRLGDMLLKAAKWNERETQTFVARITALLGPAMTVIMGLVVAGVIAAVMSGVLSLNEAVG